VELTTIIVKEILEGIKFCAAVPQLACSATLPARMTRVLWPLHAHADALAGTVAFPPKPPARIMRESLFCSTARAMDRN